MASKLLPLGAVRTEDGEVVVPASRRADGSVRKTIRIRQGYVPQDEVPKYKTVAQRRREQEVAQAEQKSTTGDPELSLQSLSLERKAGESGARKQEPPVAGSAQRKPRPASAAPPASANVSRTTATERKPPARGGNAAAAPAQGNAQDERTAERKQELSKLNQLLKEISKLESLTQEDGNEPKARTLTPQQQRKVERKAELQRERSEIIAELSGGTITNSSSKSKSRSSAAGPEASEQKKKSFVAIEL